MKTIITLFMGGISNYEELQKQKVEMNSLVISGNKSGFTELY